MNADDILRDLNANKVKQLIPLFAILGFLMPFGLIGNGMVLMFIWRKAKECITSFFVLVLAIVDLSVCLTIGLAIYNYTAIYMFNITAICKLYVSSKFCTALISGYMLIVIAAYRYRKMCHPLERQLGMTGARISFGFGILLSFLFTIPQIFLIDTVTMEIPNLDNLTVYGCDCVTKALNNQLQILQYLLDGSLLMTFVVSFVSVIVLYSLQGRAILNMKKNRTQLMPCKILKTKKSVSDHSDRLCKAPATSLFPAPSLKQNQSCSSSNVNIEEDMEKSSSKIVSMSRVTLMFFVISLGFILTFMPYVCYALWRTFQAKQSDILFTTDPLHLFCLNSYMINSVVNPIIYAVFHAKFRKYVKRFLCSWRSNKF